MSYRRLAMALCAAAALAGLAPAQALVLYAAGDVAQCGRGPASASAAARTARLIPPGAPVAMLGDASYPHGDTATLQSCYGPTWGAHLAQTYAVPGNHDYVAGSLDDYARYFARGNADPRYYRAAVGGWWFIGLDSNLRGSELDAQMQWLRAELEAIRGDGRCIIAAWHHPLYSTGLHAGDGEPMRPAWQALAEAGAAVVLNGHEHYYEAFGPRNAEGRDTPGGVREFIVGTGGARLADTTLAPWRHRAYARRHGVLELTLEPESYRWRFVSVGGRVLDQGDARCQGAPQSR